MHITDLLNRFTNAALGDTCLRVGGDPARKLGETDRLIGSSKLALEQGVCPAYIAVGIAGGLCRYLKEAGENDPQTAVQVLQQISGLNENDQLYAMALEYYRVAQQGDVTALRSLADRTKAQSLENVI